MAPCAEPVRVAIVGDFDGGPTKLVTAAAIAHAANALKTDVQAFWLATEALAGEGDELERCDGIFVAPGSPYRSMEGALRAIRFARERGVPLLGTCGGFQHVVVEYARNVLGVRDAGHAEYSEEAARLVITRLECSRVGQRAKVRFDGGSRVAAIHGATEVEEEYRCSFGLNPAYRSALEGNGLRFSGTGGDGAARVAELPSHPFFVATLYVPQVSSTAASPHPLVVAFVSAAALHADRRA